MNQKTILITGVGGFLLALCAVIKPSMYLLVFPVVTLEFLFFQRPQPIRYLWRVAVGALPVILLWIWIILPHPFTYESWQDLFYLYSKPFHSHTVFTEFPKFFIPLALHSTSLYFLLLTGIVGSAWYGGRTKVRHIGCSDSSSFMLQRQLFIF